MATRAQLAKLEARIDALAARRGLTRPTIATVECMDGESGDAAVARYHAGRPGQPQPDILVVIVC